MQPQSKIMEEPDNKEFFEFVKQFREYCSNTYNQEVQVIVKQIPNVKTVDFNLIIKTAEYLMQNDENLPVDLKVYRLQDRVRYGQFIAYKRATFWFLYRAGYSYVHIGKEFKMNHSSILLAARRFTNLMDTKDLETLRIFNRIKNELEKITGISQAIGGNSKT